MTKTPKPAPRAIRGNEHGVELEGLPGQESQGRAEGRLEQIHDEVEPGAGAHEFLLGQFHGEKVDRHDGACGIGHHGEGPREDADDGSEELVFGLEFDLGHAAHEVENYQNDDHAAEEGLERSLADDPHEKIAQNHAEGRPDEYAEQMGPYRTAAPVGHGHAVRRDEDGEKKARRGAHGHGHRDEGHEEGAQARDTRLGDARQEGRTADDDDTQRCEVHLILPLSSRAHLYRVTLSGGRERWPKQDTG